MKILLINPSQKNVYGYSIKPSYPPLGLLYIASCLEKEGHIITVLDFDNDNMNPESFKDFFLKIKPDLVGLTATTSTILNAQKLTREIKKIDKILIVIGGIHATIAPRDTLKEDSIDFLVIGEGERTIVELVNEIQNKKPNFHKM